MTSPAARPWPGFTAEVVPTRAGHGLHLERGGAGPVTVVFESGLGASRNTWGAVAPLLVDGVSAAVYDRAGLGRSAPAAGARDLAALATDLADVLDHLGDGPFILVGHSWGGPIIRRAAAARPGAIAGLVLVDPTDERCDLFFSKANERQIAVMQRFGPALARTGAIRLGLKRLAALLPEPAAGDLVAEDGTADAVDTHRRELRSMITDLHLLRADPPPLPPVAFVVISGTKVSLLERQRRPALLDAHRASVRAEPRGRHVEATRSTHYVPFTEPELVAAEIRAVAAGAAEPTPDRPEREHS